jgi:hypothetical protein
MGGAAILLAPYADDYNAKLPIRCVEGIPGPITGYMDCPKCSFPLDSDPAECPRCGIVVAKFLRAHGQSLEAVEMPPLLHPIPAGATAPDNESTARSERTTRAVALPLALLFAWLAVKGSPGAVRMLGMWVHESGHALAAWLCGYLAWPGPWFTPVGTERSPFFTVLLVGLLAYGGYRAWQIQRWFWVTASVCTLLLVLFCTLGLRSGTAQQLIVFGGDGGGTIFVGGCWPSARWHSWTSTPSGPARSTGCLSARTRTA